MRIVPLLLVWLGCFTISDLALVTSLAPGQLQQTQSGRLVQPVESTSSSFPFIRSSEDSALRHPQPPKRFSTIEEQRRRRPYPIRSILSRLFSKPLNVEEDKGNESDSNIVVDDDVRMASWNPQLRQAMAFIAGLGMMETAYLTFADVTRTTNSVLCLASSTSTTSSCSSVLQGPYAHIPGTEIPLAAVGFIAYSVVASLAIAPLVRASNQSEKYSTNQVALTTVTSSMAAFSLCLMSILLFILHETCLYCFGSAGLSVALAALAWFGVAGNNVPNPRALSASALGSISTVVAAGVLVTSVSTGTGSNNPSSIASSASPSARERVQSSSSLLASTFSPSTATLLAATAADKSNAETKQQPTIDLLQSPPAITTESSDVALRLAKELQSLDAKFYGAFWCGHCYDQKQAFGKQAMARIPYIECSKDGVNAQVSLCKEKKVPGYPTWEINGKLYPGEQALEELQSIVVEIKAAAVANDESGKDSQKG